MVSTNLKVLRLHPKKRVRANTYLVWKKKKVSFYTKDDISITVPKRDRKKINFKVRYQSPLIAPVAEDQYIADFLIKKNDQTIKSYKLYATNNVSESNFFF